ncbi:PWI domain [Teratosphaeria destructans]|uniref:PWI domain n=1 Tax=Teratosphaeria destructans TaxID=418781 RepID=A0A9W7SP44_9PEZI|nr:PWI domain [Teratosphaeria destructans]
MAYNYTAPPGFNAPRGPMGQAPPMGMPPAGMPVGMDFSAPVLRFDAGGRPPRAGLGSNAEPLGGGGGRNLERDREKIRDQMLNLTPPTREEVARTIFVGGLGDGKVDDDQIELVLRCAGKLRRWTRVRDADDKKCKFGFAEYEDSDSLEAATEIFRDGIDVPIKGSQQDPDAEPETIRVLVVADEQCKKYIAEWRQSRREDDEARQFRIDGCKEDLRLCLTSMGNMTAFDSNQEAGRDGDGDMAMGNGMDGENANGDVPTIPLTLEDELSDIPAEQRATVAAEIRAFRDRSTKRDIERLRREEELEQAERNRSGRVNRLASPPPTSAPSGPNGAPVGPRSAQVAGAPAGPKGFRGAQLPSDYANGVSFVGPNGINREDEDAEESDEELERRRQAKKDEELERAYLDAERKWQNRERTRGMAQERENAREAREKAELDREKEIMAKRLKAWNDDEEARLCREEYYLDRSSWNRKRAIFREREEAADRRDREAEAREQQESLRRAGEAAGQADDFLDQMGADLARKSQQSQQPGNVAGAFKISLGSAAAKTKPNVTAPVPKRGMADVEGLLEDEEDAPTTVGTSSTRPKLKPLTDLSTIPDNLTESEKLEGREQLAREIPSSTEELYSWPVQWRHLTESILEAQIRPFVERKIVEYLGVQEDLLVDAVVEGLRERRSAGDIEGELEGALEDEAGVLVKRVWRMVVFWTEAGGRGFV